MDSMFFSMLKVTKRRTVEMANLRETLQDILSAASYGIANGDPDGAQKSIGDALRLLAAAPAPDHSAGAGVNLHRKARELLAAEYARDGQAFVADRIRTDAMLTHVEDRSLRAIVAALAQPADADAEGGK